VILPVVDFFTPAGIQDHRRE